MRTTLSIKKHLLLVVLLAFNTSIAQAAVLHDNGPLINSPGLVPVVPMNQYCKP